jgi:hypothetical protein
MRSRRSRLIVFLVGIIGLVLPWGAAAGSFTATINPSFAYWNVTDLGGVPGCYGPYGGLTLTVDLSSMLVADQANSQIKSVPLIRDAAGHITGFGSATFYATAPAQSDQSIAVLDGGLLIAGNQTILYSQYGNNAIGEILPGNTKPDLTIPLDPLGISGSVGSLTIVPDGFGGAGRLKLTSYDSSTWYDALLTADASGLYSISDVSAGLSFGSGGLEGITYVKGGQWPDFPVDSVLISEYDTGAVVAYAIDSNGDPIQSTRRVFMTLDTPSGLTADPITGDLLIATSSFDGDHIFLATDPPAPVPEPATLFLLGTGLLGAARFAGRRKKR